MSITQNITHTFYDYQIGYYSKLYLQLLQTGNNYIKYNILYL